MRRLAIALSLSLGIAACAKPSAPEVENVWARDTVGSTANAAIFMTITSRTADRLVAASTPVAKKTDLMTIQGSSSIMDMTYVNGIDIPANVPVDLNPTGMHIWLVGLRQPLRAGQRFPLVLKFQNAGERRVAVSVIAPAASAPASNMQM